MTYLCSSSQIHVPQHSVFVRFVVLPHSPQRGRFDFFSVFGFADFVFFAGFLAAIDGPFIRKPAIRWRHVIRKAAAQAAPVDGSTPGYASQPRVRFARAGFRRSRGRGRGAALGLAAIADLPCCQDPMTAKWVPQPFLPDQNRDRRASEGVGASPREKGRKSKTPSGRRLGTGRKLACRPSSQFCQKLPDKDSNKGQILREIRHFLG